MVIAAQAPGLEEALERAVREGTPYVILDGEIVASDRCREKTVSRKGREIDLLSSARRHRTSSPRPDAIRAQEAHVKVTEKTHLNVGVPMTRPLIACVRQILDTAGHEAHSSQCPPSRCRRISR